MNKAIGAPPRVLYCSGEDAIYKKLSRSARDFVLEARQPNFTVPPQKFARNKKASILILKIKKEFDLRYQEWLSRNDASVPVIVLCQDGSVEVAVHALQYGVFDYFCVNHNIEKIVRRIREALAWTNTRALKWEREKSPRNILTGSDPQIAQINERVRAIALDNQPLLLFGETGTGKEHLAYGIYRSMFPEGSRPFVQYDCRILQQLAKYDGHSVPEIVRSRLLDFKNRSIDGVVFLNHAEQISVDQQEYLLAQAAGNPLKFIASYQEPLSRLLEDKLAALFPVVRIPPLRQRKNDIPILAEHFILGSQNRNHNKSLSGEMVLLMQEYSWPGNVKELRNLIERMIAIEPSHVLSQTTWKVCHGYGLQMNHAGSNQFSTLIEDVLSQSDWERGRLYDGFMEKMKRVLVNLVMPRVDYNQATAARVLGISRNTLRDLLRER